MVESHGVELTELGSAGLSLNAVHSGAKQRPDNLMWHWHSYTHCGIMWEEPITASRDAPSVLSAGLRR